MAELIDRPEIEDMDDADIMPARKAAVPGFVKVSFGTLRSFIMASSTLSQIGDVYMPVPPTDGQMLAWDPDAIEAGVGAFVVVDPPAGGGGDGLPAGGTEGQVLTADAGGNPGWADPVWIGDAPEDGDGYVRKDGAWALGPKLVSLTQSAYDALDPPDPDTFYFITE